ncbi:MAG: phage head-tail connector protein [Candidatus Eisenbacteria sp.]|nr:phage head-tail connector protein [Candidatus Eisenbacteria bacterium]
MKPTILVTPPTIDPVTVAEAKALARIETDGADTTIEELIAEATSRIEEVTSRQLVEATRKLFLNDFPGAEEIELPRPPLQSVTSVEYRDTDGTWQTLTVDDDYVVDTSGGGTTPDDLSNVGRIYLPQDASWPSTYDEPNSVRITYVCGYPLDSGAATTPQSLKQAIKYAVADLYDGTECRQQAIKNIILRFKVDFFL